MAQEQARRANEEERLRQLQQQALVLKRQRLAAQKQVAELKERQLQLNKAEEKRISAEKQKSLAVKAAKEKQAKALATKQTQLQKELLQQQMAQEQQAISSARATQMQGVLDQYKAAILQAIQNRWIVPDDADKTRSCILLIRLGPGGVVLSVDTVKSSGDPVLDRSAQVAVFKSSPLPVPQDPSIFEKFRELRLTVRPLQVTQQAG